MSDVQKLREALRWILECAEARNTDKKARTVNLLFSRLTLDMWQERAHEALQQSGKKKDGWLPIDEAPVYVTDRSALVGQWSQSGWKKVAIWEPQWTRDACKDRGATHWWPHLSRLPAP